MYFVDAPFQVGSDQYEWLVNDLASFNRAATPWLVASFHAPWYSSYTTHYMGAHLTPAVCIYVHPYMYINQLSLTLN